MNHIEHDAIKDIPFFRYRLITDIVPYYNKRASSLEKVIIKTQDQNYFGKNIGENKVSKLIDLYNKLSCNQDLLDHLPDLVDSGNGWVFYRWIEGTSMDKTVWRWLFTGDKRVEQIVYLLGKWLSKFHKHNLLYWLNVDEYLLKHNLAIPIDLADIDKVPICKTYNDFTLKNILVSNLEVGSFYCLDLDAAFHKDFPKNMIPYHDLSLLFGNLFSYSKLPSVSIDRILYLWTKFLDGYFYNFKDFEYSSKLFWLFLYYHNKGDLIDRSRFKIYSGLKNMVFRYRFMKYISQGPKALMRYSEN